MQVYTDCIIQGFLVYNDFNFHILFLGKRIRKLSIIHKEAPYSQVGRASLDAGGV